MPRRRVSEPTPLFPKEKGAPAPSGGQDAWSLDQLAKSEFFHQKLHEWGLAQVAYQIESVKGETLAWDLAALGISQTAWDRVIHRGIKPIVVFAHPHVLGTVPHSAGYYRMLSMVSQKSMNRIGLATAHYEETTTTPNPAVSQAIAHRLNEIISLLIESDEEIDAREFDLWRGMTAGSQAQGSWQNTKGSTVEALVKTMLRRRLRDRQLVDEESSNDARMTLKDGRKVVFADEPDVGIYREDRIIAALEIKGGIDTAGVLERVGAAMKSLSRAKESNPEATTILILQGVSVTPQATEDLRTNQNVVNYWLTVEDVTKSEQARERLFELLGI